MDRILFYSPKGPYGEFSNFSPHPIVLLNHVWPTVEHYFQAQKFADAKVWQLILADPSPMGAATIGRDRSLAPRPDWEEVKNSVMYEAVLAKALQNADIAKLLLSTGSSEIVEHTAHDNYWGDGGDGKGQNHLGKILMKVREVLITKRLHIETFEVVVLDEQKNELPARLIVSTDDASDVRGSCAMALRVNAARFSASDASAWHALQALRKCLEQARYWIRVNGSARNVHPSGMSISMSNGVKAYVLELGKSAMLDTLVEIYEWRPGLELATVDEQNRFYKDWCQSLQLLPIEPPPPEPVGILRRICRFFDRYFG